MPLSGGLCDILHKMPIVWFERSYIHQLFYLLDFNWNYNCIFGTKRILWIKCSGSTVSTFNFLYINTVALYII